MRLHELLEVPSMKLTGFNAFISRSISNSEKNFENSTFKKQMNTMGTFCGCGREMASSEEMAEQAVMRAENCMGVKIS